MGTLYELVNIKLGQGHLKIGYMKFVEGIRQRNEPTGVKN